jgi:3D (Asp-Asp-Asp) domain-containing protein
MSINLKNRILLEKLLLYTLIFFLTSGIFFSFFPLMRKLYEVEADIISHHSDKFGTSIDLDSRLFLVQENTIYPQTALKIEPKINAVTVEEKTPTIIKNFKVLETINTTITGYSSTVDQTNCQPFITASGAWVEDGIVAANFLPFGTQIRIPEYFKDKIFVVKDRMNQRHNDRIDVWFSNRQQALRFGIKYTSIEIVQEI